MRILAIESSCDETAAAVLTAPWHLHSSVVASQIEQHRPFGGVVPEIASRHHIVGIVPTVQAALAEAGVGVGELDAVAATIGPGLIGSLMVGVQVAKGIALARGIPFLGVHHLEGHLCACFLSEPRPQFPFLALLASGGHTGLYDVRAVGSIRCLGSTRDDAAGEAFDKVGKLLGLPYPGGVSIEKAAHGGEPRFRLPRPLPGRDNLDFSYSGLKTAARRLIDGLGPDLDGGTLADVCASVQQAIVQSMIGKARNALRRTGAARLVVAGGVSANMALRKAAADLGKEMAVEVFLPDPGYCTDNAAMIAVAAAFRLERGESDPLDRAVRPTLPLGTSAGTGC